MNLRTALIQQAPSLALQRAAQVEIARLDSLVRDLGAELAAAHELLSLAQRLMPGPTVLAFARASEQAGLDVEGATRHHERATLLARVQR